jgi:hypothetical protein
MLKLLIKIPSNLNTGQPAEKLDRGGWKFDFYVAPYLTGTRPGDEGVDEV